MQTTHYDDADIYLALSHDYPLLSRAQEGQLDLAKWQAVESMQSTIVTAPSGVLFLDGLLRACKEMPPRIDMFAPRRDYYLLASELGSILARGKLVHKRDTLSRAIQSGNSSTRELVDLLQQLQLPGALVAAIALWLSGTRNRGLAKALDLWSKHWPGPSDITGLQPDKAQSRSLRFELARYEAVCETFVLHNIRLVYTVARRFSRTPGAVADLVQDGVTGLMRAAQKYDHKTGYRFSTYAYNWIAQAIRRASGERGGLIRIPAHVRKELTRYYAEGASFQAVTGRFPLDTELAETLGISLEKSRRLAQYRDRALSIDAPLIDDEVGSLHDKLTSPDDPEVLEVSERRSINRHLQDEISGLNPREALVVRLRWGLFGATPESREQVANRLSVSRERVRQIELSALGKLRSSEVLREIASGIEQA